MKKIIIILTFAVCMLLLIGEGAQADILDLGGSFSYPIYSIVNGGATSFGGGSVDPSYLEGNALQYVYCIDIDHLVYVPGSYEQTAVNNAANIHGSPVNNAGEVAWLLATYGAPGQGYVAQALQAAIWTVINGYDVYHLDTTNSPANVTALYNTMLENVVGHTGLISDFFWISPGHNDSNVVYQGLVAYSPVPISPTAYLLFTGLVGLYGIPRRFKVKQ